ncbi:MAG: glycosyltransferase family 1 protein [Candidatus Aminicenantes bacterium]|jgi:glycosyltransferase involved in cell wall biosynthesis
MRVGFDVRPFLKEETGVGIYFKNLLFALAAIDRENEYFLFSSSWKDRFDPRKIPPFAHKHFRDLRYPVRMINFLWYKLGWPSIDLFYKTRLDLAHSPTPLVLPSGGKKIVTVYDLCFLEYPHLSDDESRHVFSSRIEHSLHRADKIITISHFSREQILKRFSVKKDKIHVTHLGIDRSFWRDITREEMERIRLNFHLPSSYLLFVGAQEPRKNILRLIEALKIVHNQYRKIPLVLAGRAGKDSALVMDRIKTYDLEKWIYMTGYTNDFELRGLYRSATAFVFPSICEGFGLPLLEAMASGIPIVASEAPALPEICRDAALFFDPEHPENIADVIIRVLKNADLREDLVKKGEQRVLDFSWEATAKETLSIYRSLVGAS